MVGTAASCGGRLVPQSASARPATVRPPRRLLMVRLHSLTVFVGLASAVATAEPGSQGTIAPPDGITQFLKTHCVDCHDGKDAEGGFDLGALGLRDDSSAGDRSWATVIERVVHGEMPPAEVAQPAADETARFVATADAWLRDSIHARDVRIGRVRGRRLTRSELERSLHAVLGIDVPLAEDLPEEGRPGGYTTVADRQTISHHQLGAILAVVDRALDEAFSRALVKREPVQIDMNATAIARSNPTARVREPELRQGKAVVWSGGPIYYGRLPCTTAPHDGWYRFRVTASGLKLPQTGGVWCTVHTGTCVSSAPLLRYVTAFEAEEEARDIVFECWLPKRHMLEIRPGDTTLAKAKFANGQVGAGEGESQDVPGLAIDRIVMEEIHRGDDDDGIRRLLFGDVPMEEVKEKNRFRPRPDHLPAAAERLVRSFAERAFRRPVTDTIIADYVALVRAQLDDKASFADALRTAYRAILCSPRFLYLTESPKSLDDHALASRLSYFLSGAPPDAQLRTLAAAGKLRDPKVLQRETDRLLSDDGLQRFVHDFADEWLDLDQIDFTQPDPKLYPSFDPVVQAAMLAETRLTLVEAIAENRPVSWLIDSNTTWLNSRLARYYGMSQVHDDTVQLVTVASSTHRGGLLAQGAILKITANGNNTSPVVRGVWINERILGEELRPPPGGVPAIEPDIRGTTTIREQLERHRADATCAACHKTIDPPGFALENFDPSGSWRDHYLAMKQAKQIPGVTIDPSSTLVDGRSFATFDEYRSITASNPERLARNLAGHLLVYGTGGTLSYADRTAVAAIAKEAAKQGYGVRSILHAVVTSPVFTTK